MWRYFALLIFFLTATSCITSQEKSNEILTGAAQLNEYLPLIQDKRIGLFVNHTSLIGSTHLTDTLLSLDINVTKVFSPEHGFLGNKPDGETIENEESDAFELISLYGKSKKPSHDQVADLNLLIIDIQDVGVRCYTYASTMTYLMDACAQAGVPVLILDRPNPNGSYVDGPVLDLKFKSFVGLHPIPLVHGLTLGELAHMINEEGWLESGKKCDLSIIKVKNWIHEQPYPLPIAPSPNLPNDNSVMLYPSLVLFEGTVVSVGRGTDLPFQSIGHPQYQNGTFTFTPKPNDGSKYPPLENELCYGDNLILKGPNYTLNISYLLSYYQNVSSNLDGDFFNAYFTKLAGTDQLQTHIESGWSKEEIRQSWANDLAAFKKLRLNYLLYP
ncbi:MAG: DUF1343 domain-containing protein [Cyclobacteriaceae bacterium]